MEEIFERSKKPPMSARMCPISSRDRPEKCLRVLVTLFPSNNRETGISVLWRDLWVDGTDLPLIPVRSSIEKEKSADIIA